MQFWSLLALTSAQFFVLLAHLLWALYSPPFESVNERRRDTGRRLCTMKFEEDLTYCPCYPNVCGALGENDDAYCVNPLVWCFPCFGSYSAAGTRDRITQMSPNAKLSRLAEAFKGIFGLAGMLAAMALLVFYGLAETNSLPPWPGLDSINAVAIMGLVWSVFPTRRINHRDNPTSIWGCGAHKWNYLFAVSALFLVWGAAMCFWQVADKGAQGSKWFAAGAQYSFPVNVSLHGYWVGINSTADAALYSAYVTGTTVTSFMIGVLASLAFLGHAVYAFSDWRMEQPLAKREMADYDKPKGQGPEELAAALLQRQPAFRRSVGSESMGQNIL